MAGKKKKSTKAAKAGSKKTKAKTAKGTSKKKAKGAKATAKSAKNQPDSEVRDLAIWSLTDPASKKAFRVRAAKAHNFRAALAKEPKAPKLTSEEAIQFCEGWLYLARLEFGTTDADNLDQQIVIRAAAHIQQGIEIMNG